MSPQLELDLKGETQQRTDYRTSDGEANRLTQRIIGFIRRRGWQAERISVIGRAKEKKDEQGHTVGVQWVKSNMQAGTADISATIAGRSVKIEVKIGADRQSEKQRIYQQQIEAAGGVYYIARTFEEFIFWYNSQKWHTLSLQ